MPRGGNLVSCRCMVEQQFWEFFFLLFILPHSMSGFITIVFFFFDVQVCWTTSNLSKFISCTTLVTHTFFQETSLRETTRPLIKSSKASQKFLPCTKDYSFIILPSIYEPFFFLSQFSCISYFHNPLLLTVFRSSLDFCLHRSESRNLKSEKKDDQKNCCLKHSRYQWWREQFQI